MRPSDISLVTANEQKLLVATEPHRLDELAEDDLADLLGRVRRARKKYTDLDRRQSRDAMAESGRRGVTTTSNQRTARKAEVFADAVSRVSRYLSRAARRSANELKAARIEAARAERESSGSQPPKQGTAGSSRTSKSNREIVPPARRGATSAANKRQQASRDRGDAG